MYMVMSVQRTLLSKGFITNIRDIWTDFIVYMTMSIQRIPMEKGITTHNTDKDPLQYVHDEEQSASSSGYWN
jgi:hypothetical protein